MATMAEKKERFLELARKEKIGTRGEICRAEVMYLKNKYDIPYPSWLCTDPNRKIRHGVYSCEELMDGVYNNESPTVGDEITVKVEESTKEIEMKNDSTMNLVKGVDIISEELPVNALVPEKNPLFVRHGNCKDIEDVIKTERFLPIWVTGLSGNGKTFMIEQICAKLNREFVRANITNLTDEDDLIGGFRLINGETVWQDGPVTLSMKRGAILLLDEVDLGTEKIMCLQPVLEGKGIFIKKINKFVSPSKGFNVLATSNTKGQGGEHSDRFIGTNIMNEAFLERFAITLEQDYPTKATEKKILMSLMENLKCVDEEYCDNLISWADGIRRTFATGGIEDIITTRRLCQIVNIFSIFNDRKKAIGHAIARFNQDSREAFMNLYEKVDETVLDDGENEKGKEGENTQGVNSDQTQYPSKDIFENLNYVNNIIASDTPLTEEVIKNIINIYDEVANDQIYSNTLGDTSYKGIMKNTHTILDKSLNNIVLSNPYDWKRINIMHSTAEFSGDPNNG